MEGVVIVAAAIGLLGSIAMRSADAWQGGVPVLPKAADKGRRPTPQSFKFNV
ncbi:MAG: hypothetical protein VB142_09025 [Burkholderia sp.]